MALFSHPQRVDHYPKMTELAASMYLPRQVHAWVDHYPKMTELAASMYLPRQSLLPRAWRLAAAAVALGLLALGLVDAFQSVQVSFALALVGGVALTGLLLLTIRHFDTAVAIGLLLMGVVRFEPAPTDLVFAVVIAVAAITGRFHLARVPRLMRWIV